MIPWPSLLAVAHLGGFALGAGAATLKLVMLLRCKADPSFVPSYLRVAKLATRQIILGMILLTLSGIVWLFLGYPYSTRLIVKLVLVAAIWVLGPVIDNVIEPKFQRLAPRPGESASPAFSGALHLYMGWELVATLLFYVILVLWAWRT